MEQIINSAGTHTGDIILNATGSGLIDYGPASGTRTINGDVTINGNATGTINLRNLNITGDLTINTPGAHVTGAITTAVGGTTNVVAVSNTSFVSSATHTGGIVVTDSDGATINLSGNASNANVTLDTDGSIKLEGAYNGTVTLTQGANVTVARTATIDNLIVGSEATGATVNNDGSINNVTANTEVIVTGTAPSTSTGNVIVSPTVEELALVQAALGAKDYVYSPVYNYSYESLNIENNIATLTFDKDAVLANVDILMNDMARYLGALHRVDDGATIKSIEYGGTNYTWNGNLKGSNWKNGSSLVGIITAQFKANPTTFDTIALTLKDANGNSAALTLKFVAN